MKTTPIKSEPLPELPLHQINWIFAAAQEHFAEKLRQQLITLTLLRDYDEPLISGVLTDIKPLKEQKEDCERWIAEYTKLTKFCMQARNMLNQKQAQEFARAFKEHLERAQEPTYE